MTMTPSPISLGFIGGGMNSAVGESHFIAAQMDGLFSIEAGCFSRDQEINNKTAEKWHISPERVYESWEQLLESEHQQVDAIVILTPTPYHTEVVLAALNLGISVICEKALAPSSRDAELIERTLVEKGGKLFVTYNYTGYPMLRELRDMIQRGRLGNIEQIHIEMPQEGFARLNRDGEPMIPQQWRLKDAQVPTISLDLGVHLHHMVDFLTGEHPVELVASQNSLGKYHEVVDNITALVHYSNGMECSLWYSKTALGHRNGLRVRVYGEEGSAEWYQFEPELLTVSDNRGHTTQVDRANVDVNLAHLQRYNRFKAGHPAGFLEAFANIYVDIADSLKGQNSNEYADLYSVQHAKQGLVMLEAISVSAAERRWVSLENTDA